MFIDWSDHLAGNPAQLQYGIAVTDIDNDGAFELIVTGFGCPTQVLKWDGEALFDIADAALCDPERRSIGVAAADIDGDGREEIYILNTDTFAGPKRFGDRLFTWRQGAGWVDLFSERQNRGAMNATAGRSVACIDRRGCGRYGFVVANYGGPFRLYEIGDDNRLADVASTVGIARVAGGRALVCLPLVSARMDIFATNENGANYLFRNTGIGTFQEVAAEYGISDPLQHGRGVAVLDIDGDGRLDLTYGNWEGPHRLLARLSEGPFRDLATDDYRRPCRVRTVIAADFDNDGHEEILFNNIGEPNRLFGWRGRAWRRIEIGEALEPHGLGTGAAVADVDNDGQLELLIAHGEQAAQPLTLYKPRPNANGWLRVMPLTQHGAPARGALVVCSAEGRRQVRAIDAGSGYLCQMEPVAHFGLGDARFVEQVEIRWPDGATATLRWPEINRCLKVPHPSG